MASTCKRLQRQPLLTCRSAAVQASEVSLFQEVFPAPAPGQFAPDKLRFSEEHRIRGYEVAPDQRANVVTVANLLQVRRHVKGVIMRIASPCLLLLCLLEAYSSKTACACLRACCLHTSLFQCTVQPGPVSPDSLGSWV